MPKDEQLHSGWWDSNPFDCTCALFTHLGMLLWARLHKWRRNIAAFPSESSFLHSQSAFPGEIEALPCDRST